MTPFLIFLRNSALFGGMLVITTCSPKTPTGQVLATVNGVEITTRDLEAELAANGTAPSSEVDRAALDAIITRLLVANEGRRLGLDQSPDYLALLQRGKEVLLGSQTLVNWARTSPNPAPAAIQTYIMSHPLAFRDRRLIELEQIVTGPANLPEGVIRPIKTMSEVATILQTRGITSNHRQSTLDTAFIPDTAAKQLLADSTGEPIVQRIGNHLVFSAVTAIRSNATPPSSWNALASEQLRQSAIQQRVSLLRKNADIKYQSSAALQALNSSK